MHLMNARVMPTAGLVYHLRAISPEKARQVFEKNLASWKSYVGYPNACRVALEVLGQKIPISREITHVKAGDELLIMALRYRVAPVTKKGRYHGNSRDDYDWYYCYVTNGTWRKNDYG